MTLDPDSIKEQGLTPEQVIDRNFVAPEDVEPPQSLIDGYPENEAPGTGFELTEDGDGIRWKYEDGWQVEIIDVAFTDWKVRVLVPESQRGAFPLHMPGEHAGHQIRSNISPTRGYVTDFVTDVDNEGVPAVIVGHVNENHWPIFEAETWAEDLREHAENSMQGREELEEAIAAARQNKSDQ